MAMTFITEGSVPMGRGKGQEEHVDALRAGRPGAPELPCFCKQCAALPARRRARRAADED